jgi:hypothetical protein
MLRLEAKRSLAFGHHFSQIKLRKRWFAPWLARFSPPRPRQYFPSQFSGGG